MRILKTTSNRIRFAFCFLAATFICLNQILASDNPPISYLGIEQGLSNNSVTCIYQDHNGFMWFGTYDGLCLIQGRTRFLELHRIPPSGFNLIQMMYLALQ